MSTDRKRLTSAIQRIAREAPEIRALLKDFRNSGGKPSESATSGSGAEDRQICCDGGTSGSTNPGSDTRDIGDGGQNGLGDDPAKIDDMGGGSLTGVTDCTTGEPICFEGSDWIPPDGWDGPTDPPVVDTWELGKYWSYSWQSETRSDRNDDFTLDEGGGYSAGRPNICGYHSCPGLDCDDETDGFTCNIREGTTLDNWIKERYSAGRSGPFDCPPPGGDPDIDSACVDEPPTLDSWPKDGCVNLAIKGGKLVGSKYDPENDGSYSKPMDSIELCDEFGNSFELSPSASGGWKSISSQNPDDGYLYNAQGEQIARISESEYSDPTI